MTQISNDSNQYIYIYILYILNFVIYFLYFITRKVTITKIKYLPIVMKYIITFTEVL